MKNVFLFISALFVVCSIQAQDIFKEHGFNKEILTLSKGRYEEVFKNEEIVQIGSVLLNTKTNKIVEFLDKEIEDISFKAEHSSRFLTIDPLAEKYPWLSPYVYCANNPIRYVDPDGRDIKVYYQDENGKNRAWIFNGSNQNQAPKNQFVSDFITAYDYNVKNGGGNQMQAAATSTDYTLNLVQTGNGSNFQLTFPQKGGTEGTIFWNPTGGLETPKGTLSPATVLEHEMDHGVHWQTKTEEHIRGKETSDSHFKNMEEKRVITGSEYKTGVANGELKAIPTGRIGNSSSYRKHGVNSGNTSVIIISPISNKKKQ